MELSPSVAESDLSVLMVDAQLSRDGTPLTLTGPTVAGIPLTYTIQLDSFGRNDSGNYTCTASVRPQPPSIFLTTSSVLHNTARVTAGIYSYTELLLKCVVYTVTVYNAGVYLSLRGRSYGDNSYILITDIGEGDDGALLCFTDLVQCCRDDDTSSGMALGEWFFPAWSAVLLDAAGGDFYRSRGPRVWYV